MAGYLLQGCGWACTAPCKACGECCAASCRACDGCCGGVMRFICPQDKASPVFLTYTLGMNAVMGAIATAVAAVHFRNDCPKQLHVWLLVEALVFNLFFIVFAARIHYVYNLPDALAQQRRPARSIDRAAQICWWEPVVAVFAFAWPAALAWSVTGLSWAASCAEARHQGLPGHCSRALIHFSRASAVVTLVFLLTSAAVAAFGCCCQSLCASFQTADEENEAYDEDYPQGAPATLPSTSEAPQQSFLSSLLHPQRRFQQQYRPDYEPLAGDHAPPAQQFDPRGDPPPSGFEASAPPPPATATATSEPVVPPLKIPKNFAP